MSDWTDPDDAPLLTADIIARAQVRRGGKLVRAAKGTLTRTDHPPQGDAPEVRQNAGPPGTGKFEF
jgi:hypothetical protein